MSGAKAALWIDAFAERRYGGNPCVVILDADDVAIAERIAFARETGLSECAFLVASDKADFGARYYMPTGEIPLAGHPTVATVTALLDRGVVSAPARFTLEVGAGVMEIDVAVRAGRPPLITMTQLKPAFGRVYDAGAIAALYGLGAEDVIGAPQTVSTGTPYCVTRLASRRALEAARLDADALNALRAVEDADFIEPFLCVTEGATESGDTYARLPLPPPFPPDDPFTGSATGCMAAYLFAKGWIGRSFRAEQGHFCGRPGVAEVEIVGPADDIAAVRVGGSGVVVMRGEVAF
ncbi:MAG: PhzF family phenazine biosynthesis protein [Pseudomonadota bacterium]